MPLFFPPRVALLRVFLLSMAAVITPVAAQADSEGAALFTQRCGTCHVLPDPENLTADMWSEKLVTMAAMAQLVSEEQKASVLSYLQSNAGTEDQILEKEGQYYDRLCSACHDRASIPVTEKKGADLKNFLMDHMIEEADLDIEESDAHEVAEFMLHSSIWKQE